MKILRLLALLFPALLVIASAQEPPPVPPAPPIAPVQPPKVITKEQTIFVPFEKLEEVFAGQEQGVFLPYREFLEMWNKVNLPDKLKKTEPPVDGVVAGATYSGKVEGDLAEIKAKVNFEALKEGWSQISLGTDLALAEAKTTALLNATKDGQTIIFPKKGAYTLDAVIFGKVTRDKGRATLPLKLPGTAVSQFELTIPEKGLEFTITPASAFSAVEQGEGTKLSVYFGASQQVTISWAKKGGETALPALLFADAQTVVRVGGGALRTDVTMSYRILRTGVSAFDVTVPLDQQVLSVEGANIREWKPAAGVAGQAGQGIHIELHTPAKDSYQLRLTLEAALGALPQKPALPVVSALNVERQSGSITVNADAELVVEPSDLQNLTQQGVALTKDGKTQPGLVGSYRYLRLPYAGVLNVTEAKPQVEVASLSLLTVGTETLTLNTRFSYTVKKAGIFGVQIELPAGYRNEEAVGPMVESSTVAEVGRQARDEREVQVAPARCVSISSHGRCAARECGRRGDGARFQSARRGAPRCKGGPRHSPEPEGEHDGQGRHARGGHPQSRRHGGGESRADAAHDRLPISLAVGGGGEGGADRIRAAQAARVRRCAHAARCARDAHAAFVDCEFQRGVCRA